MIIFQKNFNTPVRNNYVEQVPEAEKQNPNWMTPWARYAKKPTPKSQEPDENALLQSALKKKNSPSYYERNSLSPQEQAALDKYTEKLRTDSTEQALNKIKEEASKPVNTPTAPTIHEDVPIITETSEEEVTPELNAFQEDRQREAEAAKQAAEKEAAELRANTGLVRGEAQGYLDSAREKANNLKEKASNTLGKFSENYGELTDGRSLGKDAAIAAGGLALAGGAYHLLKKRRDRKKAEKEALENRIKK